MNKAKMNTLMLSSIEDKIHNRFTTEELERLLSIIQVELRERDNFSIWTSLGVSPENITGNFSLERVSPDSLLHGRTNALEGIR